MNHRRKSSRKRKRTNLVFLVLVFAGLSVAAWQWANSPSVSSLAQWTNENRTFDESGESSVKIEGEFGGEAQRSRDSTRTIYPYSVIPGGVRSADELRETSAHDPVVAAHYAGFDFRKAHVITLRQPRLVYLSYRIGEKIYWTTKQVNLQKGETLITDGRITGRTRCANQISALPQKITFPQEPAIKEFDQPVGSSTQIPFPNNFRSALESRPHPSGLGQPGPPSLATSSLSPLPGGFIPIGSPSAGGGSGGTGGGGGTTSGGPGGPGSGGPGSGGPGSGGPGGPGSGPGPTPPASVPEPGTLGLVLTETLVLAVAASRYMRRKSGSDEARPVFEL